MTETDNSKYEGMPWAPKVARTMELISLQKECGFFSRLKTHDQPLVDMTIENIKLKIKMYELRRQEVLT